MTTQFNSRTLRSDGSIVYSQDKLCEILYQGKDLSGCFSDNELECQQFKIANRLCDTEIPEPTFSDNLPYTGIEWRNHWFTPEPYNTLDIKEYCYSKCSSEQEKQRVDLEINEFTSRNMIPAIRHMIYCVDTWRANKIVWGVGRGSSVASYVLFLIGITKLNPLKYNLDINEWLK